MQMKHTPEQLRKSSEPLVLVDGLQFWAAGGAVDGNSLFGNRWNLVQVHPVGWHVHSWVHVGET